MTFAAEAEAASSSNSVLVLAARLGLATVVAMIAWFTMHPFLALILVVLPLSPGR